MANLMTKSIVQTPKVFPPEGAYSNGTVGGGFIFVAGQVGVDLKGEVKVGIAEETHHSTGY